MTIAQRKANASATKKKRMKKKRKKRRRRRRRMKKMIVANDVSVHRRHRWRHHEAAAAAAKKVPHRNEADRRPEAAVALNVCDTKTSRTAMMRAVTSWTHLMRRVHGAGHDVDSNRHGARLACVLNATTTTMKTTTRTTRDYRWTISPIDRVERARQ
jgi:hypothetical protein